VFDVDPEMVKLAHRGFQQHVPKSWTGGLCTCLRPHPCSIRIWAIDYLVKAGRLVLAPAVRVPWPAQPGITRAGR
jgi:hypothetical protein